MNKEKIVMLLILAIGLVAIANAASDSVVVGPYKMSFDIGQKNGVDYSIVNVTSSNDSFGPRVYSIVFKNSSSFIKAGIDVIKTDSPVNSTSSSQLKMLMESGISNYWTVTKWNDRIIDGMPGMVAELKDSNGALAYSAGYYLPGENNTNVLIYSSWPSYSDTIKLLDTIHIEGTTKSA